VGIAAWPRQACDEACGDRIGGLREHDRHSARRLQQRPHDRATGGQDDVRLERDQFSRVSARVIGTPRAPTIVDLQVAAVGPAQLLQTLLERRNPILRLRITSQSHEDPDPPLPLVLLRARRERPCCSHSAK